MSKSLRLSEKWFNRGLWVIALVFAGFLIGLGNIIVGDLPMVDGRIAQADFLPPAAQPLRTQAEAAQQRASDAQAALDQANLKLQATEQAYASGQDVFRNWVATRTATAQPGQDRELIARTAALDALKADENKAQAAVDDQRQALLDAQQGEAAIEARLAPLTAVAEARFSTAMRASELRVFGYRLALTLPLLIIAGWLFLRQRQSMWWPFVWGFILFALFAFFVELVPYLPSYGGYVRFIVGIIVTVLVGRYAIVSLNRYLAQQRLQEAQPDTVRRQELSYDAALARLDKSVCPGCERPVPLKDGVTDFCPHCGIGLFDHCHSCTSRKSAFSPFCPSCGTAAQAG